MGSLRSRLLVMLVAAVVAAPSLAAQPAFAPDSVLVRFRAGAPAAEQSRLHRQVNGAVNRRLRGGAVSVVTIPPGTVRSAVDAYRRSALVEYAEPNYRRLLFRPVTTEGSEPGLGIANNFDEQWGLHNTAQPFGVTVDPIFGTLTHPAFRGTADADIDAPEGWGDTHHGSPAVAIAVLDSGVDCDHLDLAGKCVESLNYVAEHGSPLEDVLGHGTHVAGIAAAHTDNGIGIAGVGRSTSIGSHKVCWEDYSLALFGIVLGQCDDADLVEALDYVTASGLYQVINLSLAGPDYSITLENAIDAAWNAGIVVVAGAGNEYSTDLMYPAAYANAIAVGASDHHDNLSSFSSFGPWVSVLAPGTHILSTVPGGFCGQPEGEPSDCYDWKSGTSMSTPHVAGLAGLLWAAQPGITPQQLRSLIESSADATGALQQNLQAWVQHGRISLSAALAGGPPEAQSHHVQAMTATTVNVGRGSKIGQVTVAVVDDQGNPVGGATVAGSFAGSFNEAASGMTDAAGSAVIGTAQSQKGAVSFTFCVSDVSAAATSYDPAANALTCTGL